MVIEVNSNNNISKSIKQCESNVNKLLSGDDDKSINIVPISIKNGLNVDQFVSEFVNKINDSFSIEFERQENKSDNDNDNDEKKEMRSDSSNMMMIRKSKQNEQQIQQQETGNIYKINKIDWKFNFHYDYDNTGSKIHGIGNNGKSMKCDCKDDYCFCFCTISNGGMKPNSGIYTIKISINNTNNWNNIIGITSEKYDSNHEKSRHDKYYDWCRVSIPHLVLA